MKLDIDHLALTLQGVSTEVGGQVQDLLGPALNRRLSELKLRGASDSIPHADLGAIDAPADLDAHALTDLIAARLVDWIDTQGGAH